MNPWRAKAVPLSCVFLIAFVSSPNCVHCTLGKSPCLYTCILYIPYFIYVKNTPLPHFMYLISSVCALTYIYTHTHTHTHTHLLVYISIYLLYIYIMYTYLFSIVNHTLSCFDLVHLCTYLLVFKWLFPYICIAK